MIPRIIGLYSALAFLAFRTENRSVASSILALATINYSDFNFGVIST